MTEEIAIEARHPRKVGPKIVQRSGRVRMADLSVGITAQCHMGENLRFGPAGGATPNHQGTPGLQHAPLGFPSPSPRPCSLWWYPLLPSSSAQSLFPPPFFCAYSQQRIYDKLIYTCVCDKTVTCSLVKPKP